MTRVPCELSDILKATQALLVANGIVTPSQCYLTIVPDEMLTGGAASPRIGLSFDAFDQRVDTLSCEDDPDSTPTVEGDLIVALYLRSNLDIAGRDDQALTNATLGASHYKRLIIAALNNQELLNADGDGITWRSLTYVGFRQRGRRRGEEKDWRRYDVRFDCAYEQIVEGSASVLTDPDGNTLLDPDGLVLSAP